MKRHPNIIVILADDMGYGDAGCFNAASKIPTPNLDAMAKNGMMFRNAHATSAVCTPSRYSLLTGQYCWRSRLKSSIVWQWDAALIEEQQTTLASMLKEVRYQTACIGKWHLGWDWKNTEGERVADYLPFGCMDEPTRFNVGKTIDYQQRIGGGPVDRGFDWYYGIDVPNFPPYTWFENDRVVEAPTEQKPDDMYGCPGAAAPGWRLEDMLPTMTEKAVDYIATTSTSDEPFFLYLPLTSPHSPIVPNEPFIGQSGAGRYGDFVMETDAIVGTIRQKLKELGIADNTLLLFTSDNGPERTTGDDSGAYERLREYDHASMGTWRGIKRDVWEGGHRVPFLVEWPATVTPGSATDHVITLSDLMSTFAEITGHDIQQAKANDSVSFLPLLRGDNKATRDHAIYHSQNGTFAISKDNWVYIDGPSGGDNPEPDWYQTKRGYSNQHTPAALFYLDNDASEKNNLYDSEQDKVRELKDLLEKVKEKPHTATYSMDQEAPA